MLFSSSFREGQEILGNKVIPKHTLDVVPQKIFNFGYEEFAYIKLGLRNYYELKAFENSKLL